MTEQRQSDRGLAKPSPKKRLRKAMKVLRDPTSPEAALLEALTHLQESGSRGRSALLLILAVLSEGNEPLRFRAFQALLQLCPSLSTREAELGHALADPDEKVRLASLRQVVRLAPEVRTARATGVLGWRRLRRRLWPERHLKEEPVPQPRTLDEGAFLDALSTAVRDPNDPVVQTMRRNPGRWIVWNESTREVPIVTDDFNEAMRHVPDSADPNVRLDLAPGFIRTRRSIVR